MSKLWFALALMGGLSGAAFLAQVTPGPGPNPGQGGTGGSGGGLLFIATPANDTVCAFAGDPGFTCGNTTSASPGAQSFQTTAPFTMAAGQEVNSCWSTAFTSSNPAASGGLWVLYWDTNQVAFTSGSSMATSITNKVISQCWTVAYYSPTQLIVYLKSAGTLFASANAQNNWMNQITQPVTITGSTTGAHTLSLKTQWASAGGIGIPTYVSGGTPVGTGSCLLAASGGGGSNGQLTMNVSGGAFASFTIANTGSAYTSEPTLWNYVSGAGCSTAVTTSGGSLGGVQGNAYQLMSVDLHL